MGFHIFIEGGTSPDSLNTDTGARARCLFRPCFSSRPFLCTLVGCSPSPPLFLFLSYYALRVTCFLLRSVICISYRRLFVYSLLSLVHDAFCVNLLRLILPS